ncbi:hypothetical protein, partial [Nocardia sp. NPDC004604]|uniref:hypothetical protein n=1 Tax=Nocardia sp. NPDC004604 TaxID=3157013 RepID=UPI0033BE42CF
MCTEIAGQVRLLDRGADGLPAQRLLRCVAERYLLKVDEREDLSKSLQGWELASSLRVCCASQASVLLISTPGLS